MKCSECGTDVVQRSSDGKIVWYACDCGITNYFTGKEESTAETITETELDIAEINTTLELNS